MRYCPDCGSPVELLPRLYFCSGTHWYGCKACNSVFEHNFCSVSGLPMGIEKSRLSYREYMEEVEGTKKNPA